MKRLSGKLTYANVVSTLCLFLLLGGGAYAAIKLPANSVGTKQLKNGAVTAAKVKNGSLTGTQINASTLGTVPHASTAVSAEGAARAENANLLQGHPASDFLGANATAVNSSELGGMSASSFLGAPTAVRTITWPGPTTGGGSEAVGAECDRGEVAIGGGFQEAGIHAHVGGLGFGGTYQMRGSGPGVLAYNAFLKELAPVPASAGQTPTLWLVAIQYESNADNPEVIVYADCVPNGG